MWYNLKHAYRNLCRNGLYSAINMTGLAVSLAACILIMLWVWDELSFDRFHRKSDRIYTLNTHVDKMCLPWAPVPLGEMLVQNLPSVENCCRMRPTRVDFLEYEGQKFYISESEAADVDTTFFSMFSFRLLQGSASDINHQCVVISQTVARKLFGDREPLGETVKINTGRSYRVAGVMKDIPANSTLQYTILFFPDRRNNEEWTNWNHHTYLLLHAGSNARTVAEDIMAMVGKQLAPSGAPPSDVRMTLQNIRQHHLYMPDGTDRGMQAVRLFTVIGALILVIAGINYVNLVTARATKRSKEIGLRKVVGASKINLLGQLMSEAVLVFLTAIALAVVLVFCVLPYYNTLTAKTFDVVLFLPQMLRICAGAFVAVVLLAGLYPVYMLSSFQAVEAFKNQSGRGKNAFLRRALVVVQFVFSTGLIMGSFVTSRQLAYIQSLHPGYDRENVVMIPAHQMNINHVRGELLDLPGIAGISATHEEICKVRTVSDVRREGQNPDEIFMMTRMPVESHFISTMGLKMIAGSDFTGTEADENCFIINETAARLMGFDDPVGKRLDFYLQGVITGIVNDFHFDDMHRKIGPVLLHSSPRYNHLLLYARIEPGKTRMALENIEKLWKRYNAGYGFTYTFVDESFEKIHRADLRTGTLFNIFSFIAIMISCLGLFGLVTYTAETKRKEIGIRKVLGASVMSIVNLLSKELLILVGIAMMIAFPLAYWLLDGMLQDFAYRISISWWMFVVAGLTVIVLTLLTVGFQAIKAATDNPVKAIKSE